ncbi:MAG: DUF2269 family protein [Candidatus Limnocylindrales bacterium]
MDWVLAILLFLHIGGSIIAFRPTYAFLILGPMAASEPAHRNFALRFQQRVATTLVAPLAVLQGITGLLLVWRIGFELFQRGSWLIVSIVLYLIALALAFGIMLPGLRTLVPATAGPPPAPPAGSASAGPPPHIAATARRARIAGMVNAALIVIIVFLMVTKAF